jgi:hypothetical protein
MGKIKVTGQPRQKGLGTLQHHGKEISWFRLAWPKKQEPEQKGLEAWLK